MPTQQGNVAVDFVQPQWASVGMSLMVLPSLRMNFDVKWVDYSALQELVFEFDRNLDYLTLGSVVNNVANIYHGGAVGGDYADPNILRLQRRYQAVVDWSIGFEYQYNNNIKLRAGYEPRTSSIPENRQDLLIPIGDAKLYSVGLGYSFKEHTSIDMALGYMTSSLSIEPGESRNINSSLEGDVLYNPYRDLKIDHNLDIYVFSLTYSTHF